MLQPACNTSTRNPPDYIFTFLSYQLQALTGSYDPDSHLIYLMIAKDTPYIGRASGSRSTSTRQGGIRYRWSEHVRELQHHMTGNVPKNRARRRYVETRRGISISSLNIFIYGICDPSTVASREAVAIVSVQPTANAMELKHFSGATRPQRNRNSMPRRRPNGSSIRKTRTAILRRQADQWGETVNDHG